MKETAKHFSKIGFIYLGGSALAFVLQLGWAMLVGNMPDSIGQNYNIVIIGNMAPLFILVYPMMLYMMNRLPKTEIIKSEISIGKWISLGITSIAIMYLSNYVGTMLNSMIGKVTGKGVVTPLNDVLNNIGMPVILLLVVILAPIFEELIFRKAIIDHTVKYGEGMAIILSGIVFGLFHGNFSQFVYAMVLGMFFAYVYIRTGNIKYTIGLHMFVNFMGSFVSMAVMRNIDMDEYQRVFSSGNQDVIMEYVTNNAAGIMGLGLFAIAVIIMLIVGIVLFFVNLKKMHLNQAEEQLPHGEKFKTVFLNPGVIIYCIAWIVVIIINQIAG